MRTLTGMLLVVGLVVTGMLIEHRLGVIQSMTGGPDIFVKVDITPLQPSDTYTSTSDYIDYGSYDGFSDSYEQYELACSDAIILPPLAGQKGVFTVCPGTLDVSLLAMMLKVSN